MLLSAFKTQQHIVDAVPDCVKKAIGAGVGMFIAFCGFQSAGLIQKSDSTLVTVGRLEQSRTVLALAGIAITAGIGHPTGQGWDSDWHSSGDGSGSVCERPRHWCGLYHSADLCFLL